MYIDFKILNKDNIDDVILFENNLRKDEKDVYGWDIDESYINKIKDSFDDESFSNSFSILAYDNEKVVGRIDISIIASHFDGVKKGYLDWICVLKSYRHHGIAQMLLNETRNVLKEKGIDVLIALTASNDEAQRFYNSIPDATFMDKGIWIDIK